MQQLTYGGDNAEAYWSFDNHKLTFQATRAAWNAPCDQIFMMDITKPVDPAKTPDLISTAKAEPLVRFSCRAIKPFCMPAP
jgi:hypothetical protein